MRVNYNTHMIRVQQTGRFRKWLSKLRDRRAAAIIAERLDGFRDGSFGDVKRIGGGVMEARIHIGPGYRIYYGRRGDEIIILLTGGAKDSQKRDIEQAKAIWESLK